MDFLTGGELLDRICTKSFTEKEASEVLEKIASTIKYLHENGVSYSSNSSLKCDFKRQSVMKDVGIVCFPFLFILKFISFLGCAPRFEAIKYYVC